MSENNNQPTIDTLKNKVKKIDNCMPQNELSLQQDLQDLVNILVQMDQEDEEFFEKNYPKLNARTFFVNEFLFFLCKYIIEFKQFQHDLNQENAITIISLSLRLCLKYLNTTPDQIKLYETLKLIFDTERYFYRIRSQCSINELRFSPDIPITEEQQKFIDGLQVGDLVDALKCDGKTQVIGWSRGEVVKINENQIKVAWIGEKNNRLIGRYTWDIAPFQSKVTDEEWQWRISLKEGDLVDCPDDNIWYNATIVGKKVLQNDMVVLKGTMSDEKGKFFGWSSQYDEDIQAVNPRIQRKGTFAKPFCKYASMSNAEESIKDHNDFVYNIAQTKHLFAVPRFNTKQSRKSAIMVDLIQRFGEQGGFTLFYERVSNQQKWCPIEILHNIMQISSYLHEMLHRQFVLSYVPKMIQAVSNNLINSPDWNVRNFSYQRINDILLGLGSLGKRYYSLKEKNEMVDKLDMEISMRCFKSEFLERQLHGLKSIQDLIRKTKELQFTMQNSDLKYLNVELIVEWINENKVFETIYISNSSHIVQRSADFLKFMLDEKLVSLEQLSMIIRSAKKGEIEDKQAIYKVLKDVCQSFSKEQFTFVLQAVCESASAQMTKEDLDLLQDITKYNYKFKEEYNQQFIAFYWKLISEPEKLSQDLLDTIVNNYVELVNSFDLKPYREINLRQMVKNIENDIQVTLTLRVIQKCVEKLETQALSWDVYTKDVALTQLLVENNIIDAVFKSIVNLKSNTLQGNYIEQLKGRVEFIQYFYANIQNPKYTLDFDTVVRLWDEIVDRAKCAQEKDLVYRWFSTGDLAQGVQSNDLIRFFEEKMIRNLKDLTLEGFICLQSLVCLVNIQQGKMVRVKEDFVSKVKNNLSSMIQQNQYVENSVEVPEKKFDFKVICPLKEMFGFEVLQEVIMVTEQNISYSCRQFIIQAIENHQSDQKEVLKDYLSFTFEYLQKQKDDSQRVYRTLQIFEDVLDESEVRGIGGLKSIVALSQGEQVTIDFVNEYTNGWMVQKKFSLTVPENSTVMELRLKISKEIKASWDSINLTAPQGFIKFCENGKTIRDLRVKKGQLFKINKRQLPPIPETELVDKSGNLTPDAIKVLKEVFNHFSTEGFMTKEQCARFVSACTGNTCLQDDPQIVRTFEQYDKDKDGLLVDQNFLDFYGEAAKSKKSTVWLNLRMLHYRNDLKRGDEVLPEEFDARELPRYIISRSPDHLSNLFELLDSSKQVSEQAWYLLRRLPPSPHFLTLLLNTNSLEQILDSKSNHKLLYNLHIIEYLINSQQTAEELSSLLQTSTSTLTLEEITVLKQNWAPKFVQLGGFDEFIKIFKSFNKTEELNDMDIQHKEILSYLLKIFTSFLVALFYTQAPFLNSTLKLCSGSIPLHQISQELQKEQHDPPNFLALVQQLKEQQLTQTILTTFDLPKLTSQLLFIVNEILQKKTDLEPEDREVIFQAMNVVLCVLLQDKQLIESNFQVENPQLLKLLLEGTLTNKSSNLRTYFSRQAFVLAYQSRTQLNFDLPTKQLFSRLLSQLPECSKPQNASFSQQYYELLSSMVEVSDKTDYVDYKQLASTLVKTLSSHKSSELLARSLTDTIVVGLITLLEKITLIRPDVRDYIAQEESLIQVIFNQCLFACNEVTQDVKCKTKDSRQVAFKLLRALCLASPQNIELLIKECLTPLAQRVPVITSWNHVPGNDMRSVNGYVGIKNPGCICYMIAMLQQFYMTPTFRYAILMAQDGIEPNLQPRPKDQQLVDDNVFHQFQQMLTYLELSDRMDYNPADFCFAFKDYAGMPVDITVQQDSQEFLNILFDKLEQALKNSPFKSLLQGVYGGKTVTILTCSSCKAASHREEQFYNLSLPIKNLKTIHECFEKFISEEVISDYLCDGCNKKVDVTKRSMLGQLPNVLILHLQRIIFNLDTLMNEKINSRVEFPIELDLKNYLVEDRPDALYRLVGVVVHFGAAEFGHYFSYIDIERDREAFLKTVTGQHKEKWLEFNDSKVKEFKITSLENESFGGAQSQSDTEDWGWWKGKGENSQNAYVLVYEKLEKGPIQVECKTNEELSQIKEQFNLNFESVDEQENKIIANINYYGLPSYIPPDLQHNIVKDNQQFQLERSLFDSEFFNFLQEVCKCVELPPMNLEEPFYSKWQEIPENVQKVNQQLLSTLIPYNFDLLARALDNRLLEPLVERMKGLLYFTPKFSFEFLERFFFQRGAKTIDLILGCSESQTRSLVSTVLAQTFNMVISFYGLSLVEQQDVPPRDKSLPPTIDQINYSVVQSLNLFLLLLRDQVPKNWVRFEQYFQFWKNFSDGGKVQLDFLQSKKIITLLLDFILESNSPIKLYEKKHNMGNPYCQPNFATVFEICIKYINLCNEKNDQLYTLTKDDHIMLYSSRLIEKLFKSLKKQPFLTNFFVKMCTNNELYSELVSSCLLRSMSTFNQDDFQPLTQLAYNLMRIDDDLKPLRIEWILGYPQCEQKNYQRAQLATNFNSNFHNSQQQQPKLDKVPQFGTFKFNIIDEELFKYPSPLYYQISILDTISSNIGQYKKNDNLGLLCISIVLQAMTDDTQIRDYILRIPAMNYSLQSYLGSFQPYLEQYSLETKRFYYHTFPREEVYEECQRQLQRLQETVDINTLPVNPTYVIGETLKYTSKKYLFAIDKKTGNQMQVNDDDQEYYHIVYSDPQYDKICIIQERTYTTATCSSKPNRKGNDAFPDTVVKGNMILNYQVTHGTQVSKFFEPKAYDNRPQKNISLQGQSSPSAEAVQEFNEEGQVDVIDGYQEQDCVKTVSITNLKQKQVHFILKVSGDNNIHLPLSRMQKIVKPNSFMIFTTLTKINPNLNWEQLTYNVEFNIIEGFGDALFITQLTPEQKSLFNYR